MGDPQLIKLSAIRLDGGTQSRAFIDPKVVADYAEALGDGAALPPVVVFHDGSNHWLADGFHRFQAHRKVGSSELFAQVRQGTQRDAILFSAGANAHHGLRRTKDDKTRAVMTLLNDPEWAEWSDREIARRCGVSHPLVASLRPAEGLNGNSSIERTYTTKHGTTAKRTVKRTGGEDATPLDATGRLAQPEDAISSIPEEVEVGAPTDASAAKERRQIARLTPEAMVEEIVGLRADLAEAKAKAKLLKTERDDLKAKLAEALQGDLGRALGNAQRRYDAASGRTNELLATIKRLEYRLKKAEARVKELEETPVEMGVS